MVCRPRYFFNKELKNEFLQGIKLTHLCEKIGISYSYLASIMQGHNVIDEYMINDIMICIGYNSKDIKNLKNKYFTLRD